MRDDNVVKFSDVLSGNEGMTMIVLLGCGTNFFLCSRMIIFQNKNSSFPIRDLFNNVPGTFYRTGPKAWMDLQVFVEWMMEPRVLGKLSYGQTCIILWVIHPDMQLPKKSQTN